MDTDAHTTATSDTIAQALTHPTTDTQDTTMDIEDHITTEDTADKADDILQGNTGRKTKIKKSNAQIVRKCTR
jgi:hypothetical protein